MMEKSFYTNQRVGFKRSNRRMVFSSNNIYVPPNRYFSLPSFKMVLFLGFFSLFLLISIIQYFEIKQVIFQKILKLKKLEKTRIYF
jgi:hypothetical protein